MLTTIQDAVNSHLPPKRKTSPGGWTSFNAPCCIHNGESADNRSRGGIVSNPDGSVSYHCFNCNFKASYQPGRHLTYKFRKLLSWLGASDNEVKKLVIDAIRIKDLIKPEDTKQEEREEVSFKVRPLPENAKTFIEWDTWFTLQAENTAVRNVPWDFGRAIEYSVERRIDWQKYGLRWTDETDHNYHKRVIIPCYWKNQLIGSTARTFDDNVKPKYYSDYEPNFVFNTDMQTADKAFVIVVEGPIDAMVVDGVAILGSECSEVQADIIESLGKEVIVVPDFDIKLVKGKKVWSGVSLINHAIEYGWDVSFPIWHDTCKDVAEAVEKYGQLFVLKSIIEGRESSKLKIELRKKKIYNS
jgi:hypothetical protein